MGEITQANSVSPELLAKGSDLCVECGLCCKGFIHNYAVLYDDEIERADRLNLDHFRSENKKSEDESADAGTSYAFRLPCLCHQDGKCSVYPDRPRVCGEYKCDVLVRFLEREVSFEESQALVRETLRLVENVERYMELSTVGKSVWQAVEEFCSAHDNSEEFRRKHALFLLDVKKLERLLPRFEA